MFEYKGIKIRWLGHDSFSIVSNIKIITDPYKITKQEKADLILLSHNHFDHLSVDDLKNISTENTSIVAANECIDMLKGFVFKEKLVSLQVKKKLYEELKLKQPGHIM